MKKHILLDKAHVYENIDRDMNPKDCSYDRIAGLWRVNSTGEIMMISSSVQKAETKKCDIETGEDQKGE